MTFPGLRIIAIGALCLAATWGVSSQDLDPESFDINRDMGFILIAEQMGEAIRDTVSLFASDASLVIRITTLFYNALFDAIAPYTPSAVGIYSHLGRRQEHLC